MATYLLRVWLPDHPGALGAVAAGIGSVGADVVGMEILERDGGVAVDQLVVETPDEQTLDAMLIAVHGLEGVAVEEAAPLRDGSHDPVGAALGAAEQLSAAGAAEEVFGVVIGYARERLGADWAAVVGEGGKELLGASGSAPPLRWLEAFCEGARCAGVPSGLGGDIVLTALAPTSAELVAGRPGRRYLAGERMQLEKLTTIGGARLAELAELAVRKGRERHPSAGSATGTAMRPGGRRVDAQRVAAGCSAGVTTARPAHPPLPV